MVRINTKALNSPAAFAGALEHELHEIKAMRQWFIDKGGKIKESEILKKLETAPRGSEGGDFHNAAVKAEEKMARKVGKGILELDSYGRPINQQ